MSYRDEAKILLASLLRLPPDKENETVNDFVNAIIKAAVDEMERRPWIDWRLGQKTKSDDWRAK